MAKTAPCVSKEESQDKLVTQLEVESRVNTWRWRLEFEEKELAAIRT
jgi:hypothetical protein